jgi:hypothetical protein
MVGAQSKDPENCWVEMQRQGVLTMQCAENSPVTKPRNCSMASAQTRRSGLLSGLLLQEFDNLIPAIRLGQGQRRCAFGIARGCIRTRA